MRTLAHRALKALLLVTTLFGFANSALAGDFDWLDSLTISANKNDGGFRTRLSARFHIGDAELKTVIRDSGGKADAYMVLRLAELSHQPREKVIKSYQRYRKSKAWGKLAKSLGIKPGSKEFHALKRGHDLGEWNRAKADNSRGDFRAQSDNTSFKHHNKARGGAQHNGKGGRPW